MRWKAYLGQANPIISTDLINVPLSRVKGYEQNRPRDHLGGPILIYGSIMGTWGRYTRGHEEGIPGDILRDIKGHSKGH